MDEVIIDCIKCKSPVCCEEDYQDMYLTHTEIQMISKFSGKKPDEFVDIFWNPYLGRHISTIKVPCPFFINRECCIHPVKPLVCELFPFTLNILTHSISVERYNCKNIINFEEKTKTSKTVSLNQYRQKIGKWLDDFWK